MIAGPVILCVGMALRVPFHFFFPQQLATFAAHPVRIGAAYGCVAVGTILLAPAVIGLPATSLIATGGLSVALVVSCSGRPGLSS